MLTFQIGVNVIGLPCFHQLQTGKVLKEFVSKSKFFAVLLAALFFASCGKKNLVSTEVKKDSSTVVDVEKIILKEKLDRSLAINDSFFKNIPQVKTGATNVKDCDSLCNVKISQALRDLNTKKSSGNNSYSLYWDEVKRNVVLAVKIDETVSQYKDSISIKDKRIHELESSIKTIEIPVEKPFTKLQILFLKSGQLLWIMLFAYFGWKIYKILNLKKS